MGTLIAYATKYGCTETCAKMLASQLSETPEVVNLKKLSKVDLTKYNNVIIGGSIYMGRIQKKVKKFCLENMETLKNKRIGLFICGMSPQDVTDKLLSDAFPSELTSMAVAKDTFGGAFNFERMNFIERFIIKKISKVEKSTSNISEVAIHKFAAVMNNR